MAVKVTIRAIKLGPKRHAGLEPPAFTCELAAVEEIVGLEHRSLMGGGERKTDDHYLTVWVAKREPTG